MTLFLTSSPCVPDADRAILNPANGFVEQLRAALPQGANCLFICSDPDSPELTDHFAGEMAGAFEDADMAFSGMAVLDRRNQEDAAELIAWSDLIILSGGHVPTQNRFFREIGLSGLLQDYTGIVMGISAGSMNSAGVVYAQPELEGESIDPGYARWLPGLGLTDIHILPHYQQIWDATLDGRRLFEDIAYADSMGNTFFALVDGSYLYRAGESPEALYGEAYLIEDGRLTQIAEEGGITPLG